MQLAARMLPQVSFPHQTEGRSELRLKTICLNQDFKSRNQRYECHLGIPRD